MIHLHEFMASLTWWLLEPDTQQNLLISARGARETRAVAARTSDRSLALIHLPTARDITVDLGQLAGPQVAARWYDPAAGQYLAVSGPSFSSAGVRRLKPARTSNSSGFDDWVLVLQSAS
jgi:collagenase-like protein with putative collagen-binding domain